MLDQIHQKSHHNFLPFFLFLFPLQATDKAGAVRDTEVAATATRADMDTVTIMAIGRDGATTVMITPTTVNSTTIHRNTTIERLFFLNNFLITFFFCLKQPPPKHTFLPFYLSEIFDYL